MRTVYAMIAWLGFGLPAFAQASKSTLINANEPEALTVMTWNLEWFYDNNSADNFSKLAKEKAAPSRTEWNWRRDAIAESIAKAQPTVLAVQEIESRRVLWYLTRTLTKQHGLEYHEAGFESRDHYTEQDVGLLYRPPVDALQFTQGAYPKRMRSTNQYFDVTKHLLAILEFQHHGGVEHVTVLNVHLRSRPEGEPLRLRQARLFRQWISAAIAAGENVILLGDFNTEEKGSKLSIDSDLGVSAGLETASTEDDLVDLNLKMPVFDRATHLLGGQYDRIMCSQSLIEDDPVRPDLVFDKIEVFQELSVRGSQDTPSEHWDNYWTIPQRERDLSDHYPVMATFRVK